MCILVFQYSYLISSSILIYIFKIQDTNKIIYCYYYQYKDCPSIIAFLPFLHNLTAHIISIPAPQTPKTDTLTSNNKKQGLNHRSSLVITIPIIKIMSTYRSGDRLTMHYEYPGYYRPYYSPVLELERQQRKANLEKDMAISRATTNEILSRAETEFIPLATVAKSRYISNHKNVDAADLLISRRSEKEVNPEVVFESLGERKYQTTYQKQLERSSIKNSHKST